MKKIIILVSIICFVLASCSKDKELTRKANREYKKQNYSEATKNYEQALKANHNFLPAMYNAGNSILMDKDKNYNKAINFYSKYLSKKIGTNKKDSLNYASCLYNRGNALFFLF